MGSPALQRTHEAVGLAGQARRHRHHCPMNSSQDRAGDGDTEAHRAPPRTGPRTRTPAQSPEGSPRAASGQTLRTEGPGGLTSANRGPQGANGLRLRLPAKTTWRP